MGNTGEKCSCLFKNQDKNTYNFDDDHNNNNNEYRGGNNNGKQYQTPNQYRRGNNNMNMNNNNYDNNSMSKNSNNNLNQNQIKPNVCRNENNNNNSNINININQNNSNSKTPQSQNQTTNKPNNHNFPNNQNNYDEYNNSNTNMMKYPELNTLNNMRLFTKLQAVGRAFCFHKKFKFYKPKLVEETFLSLEKYTSDFRTPTLYKAESYKNIPFDSNGWAKYYRDDEEVFEYNYGRVFNTRILVYNEMCIYMGQVNLQNHKHGQGILLTKYGVKFQGSWIHNKFTGWGRHIDIDGNIYQGK